MAADPYPPIGSLTAIGDGYSLALLGPDAAVEWWCPLRFDADPLIWWHLGTGSVRVTSAMAWPRPRGSPQLIFHAEALAGDSDVELEFRPQPGWGQTPSELRTTPDGAELTDGDLHLRLESPQLLTVRNATGWATIVARR